MRKFIQIIFFSGSVLLVGCGGGGGSSSGTKILNETSNEVYKNSNLPSLKTDTIPETLIAKDNEKAYHKIYQKIGEKSTNFQLFQESIGYFYFKQMEMNINLGYLDSVWSQVETYCKDTTSCTIPQGTLTFIYSQELYNRDIQLIKTYEEKCGDMVSFSSLKESLKNEIGKSTKLGEAELLNLVDSPYDYELKVDISNVTFDNDELITLTKWNKENTLYQIREELINGYNFDPSICKNRESGVIYYGYDYNKSVNNIDNFYTYGYEMNCTSETIGYEKAKVDSSIQKHKHEVQLLEFANKTKLKEHISDRIIDENYHIPLDSYLEGELTESGGYVISSDTEGFYNNEKFDIEGNIIENISCVGNAGNNLDDCTINGVDIIKEIIVNNVYKVGVFSDTPINTIATHSAVFFNKDNTLNALINCTIFKADYYLNNKGITFSNIQEENNSSLVCLDSSYRDNFRSFLDIGYQFSENGYVVWNGLSAELDTISKKSKFDKKAFMEELTKNRYVDSYTMNNLFKVKSWNGLFLNLTTNQNYFLGSTPTMHIQNEKIYIDLIDATFEADINVINNDIVQFTNVIKLDKENVIYPTRNCTNEPGSNECLDGDKSLSYEDKVFTTVIEEFLNNDVIVSNSGVVDNGRLWMHNGKLSFSAFY